MFGTLFGIGVGPGAPDLLTIRAVRVLKTVDVLLTPVRRGNDFSRAFEIARPYIGQVQDVPLDFPMTRDKDILDKAWTCAAKQSVAVLAKGLNAAFLTLGDPLTYSTFSYLMRAVRALDPTIAISVVPGITSYQAASARLCEPLCEGNEHLHILSGIADKDSLLRELENDGPAVVLKAYRNYPAIRDALKASGRDEDVVQVSHVEQEQESLRRGLDEHGTPPYMTLLLSKKRKG
ncbi:MAG: precorrin-2 C(20)-methyltransferase [Desulfovibrionaceae bacterium]|nr:precorrin-2 C(20)-methyltransferase [Desulfovibrionaceae bacterium]